MRKFLSAFVLLVLAVFAGACSDSTGPSELEADISGTYTLQTVNGASPPAIIVQVGADRIEVTGGQLTLNRDKTFGSSISYRVVQGGNTSTDTQNDSGTYQQNGNMVQLSRGNGTRDSGSVSGDTLTIVAGGVTLVFQK